MGTEGGGQGQMALGTTVQGGWGASKSGAGMLGALASTGTEGVALSKQEAGPWPHPGLEGTPVPGLGAASSWEEETDLPTPSQGPISILHWTPQIM